MILSSNLLKQSFVVNLNSETRIINSNKTMEEKLKSYETPKVVLDEQDEKTESSLETEEFVEGIRVEQYETIDQITKEEVLEEAQKEAEQILKKAQKEAEQILKEAQKEAETLFEEQKKLGYEAGVKQQDDSVAQLKEQLNCSYIQKEEQLIKEYHAKSAEMERDILESIIKVFEKVFNIQFDDKKEMLLHLIKNTLMNVEVSRNFRIRVSETNHRFLESHLDDIRQRIGNDASIEIVNDVNLGASDCLIETDSGVFDCGIDMEFTNLVKAIMSLCS